MKNRNAPDRKFVPKPEQMANWPEISGNEINGVDEAESRRPSRIMWHDAETIAHGAVQSWFWEQGGNEPKLLAMRGERHRVMTREPGPIAEARVERTADENHGIVVRRAIEFGADFVGVTRTDPEWVFEGYDFDYPWIVVLGVQMDYERLKTAPEVTSALAVVDGYMNGWRRSQPLADWIRSQGWRAEPKCGPDAGPVNLIPAALACGFGELGKHGSIINRKLGSNFRLAAVFTDLPLVADPPDEFAADDFCTKCRLCTKACPVDAISNDTHLVRGIEKWYVDFDRCMPYFAETHGCGICIARCPWSADDRAPALAEKLTRRRDRVAADPGGG